MVCSLYVDFGLNSLHYVQVHDLCVCLTLYHCLRGFLHVKVYAVEQSVVLILFHSLLNLSED